MQQEEVPIQFWLKHKILNSNIMSKFSAATKVWRSANPFLFTTRNSHAAMQRVASAAGAWVATAWI